MSFDRNHRRRVLRRGGGRIRCRGVAHQSFNRRHRVGGDGVEEDGWDGGRGVAYQSVNRRRRVGGAHRRPCVGGGMIGELAPPPRADAPPRRPGVGGSGLRRGPHASQLAIIVQGSAAKLGYQDRNQFSSMSGHRTVFFLGMIHFGCDSLCSAGATLPALPFSVHKPLNSSWP